MSILERVIEEIRAACVPDPRMAVFEIKIATRKGAIHVTGESTDPDAVAQLLARIRDLEDALIHDEVVRLPDPDLGETGSALVRAAIAPLQAEPRVSSTQVSQYVLGQRLDLLSRRGAWYRVRGEDGYVGWIHRGYLEPGTRTWAEAWERGRSGEPVISLGVELADEEGRVFLRPPWGARLLRTAKGRFQIPDGRRGSIVAGEVVDADRLKDRFPPRGESVIRTARLWMGAPYLWGGVTPAGADCSGFVQAVFWVHGIALRRDSDQQVAAGTAIEPGEQFRELRAGDVLFFAEESGRVSHVALSAGGGHIIHAAVSNGGVATNDLNGDLELEVRLRRELVEARRVLPDRS